MSDVAKIVEKLNHVRYLLQGPATAQVSMDIAKSIDAVLPLAQHLEATLPAMQRVCNAALALQVQWDAGGLATAEHLRELRQAISLLQAEKTNGN